MQAQTDPRTYAKLSASTITILPLKVNARPVGFAPWPEVEEARSPTPVRKRTKDTREKAPVASDTGSSGRRKRGTGK